MAKPKKHNLSFSDEELNGKKAEKLSADVSKAQHNVKQKKEMKVKRNLKSEENKPTLVAKFTESTEKKFKATFVADGETVKVVEFAKGAKSIKEPEVPAKEGYTGKWSDYILAEADLTITAIYTPIETPAAKVKITNFKNITVDYKSSVTLHATADVAGTKIAWFNADNGQKIKDGNEYKVSPATSTFKVYAAAVDESGKEIAGTKSEVETVTVKTGLWQSILAFFRGIFGKLPVWVDNNKK